MKIRNQVTGLFAAWRIEQFFSTATLPAIDSSAIYGNVSPIAAQRFRQESVASTWKITRVGFECYLPGMRKFWVICCSSWPRLSSPKETKWLPMSQTFSLVISIEAAPSSVQAYTTYMSYNLYIYIYTCSWHSSLQAFTWKPILASTNHFPSKIVFESMTLEDLKESESSYPSDGSLFKEHTSPQWPWPRSAMDAADLEDLERILKEAAAWRNELADVPVCPGRWWCFEPIWAIRFDFTHQW